MMRTEAFMVLNTLFVVAAFAQSTLRGTVSDRETGLPIQGVGVFIPGTTIGSSTDSEGTYSFRLPDDLVEVEANFQHDSKRFLLQHQSTRVPEFPFRCGVPDAARVFS